MNGLIRISTIVILVAAFTSKASNGSRDSLLTLKRVVAYAVTNGLSMRTAVNQQRSTSMDLIAARHALFPAARAGISASSRYPVPVSSNGSTSAGASLNADYELSPSEYKSYSASKNRSSAAQSDIEQLREDIEAEVIMQFVKTIGAWKLIEVEEKNVDYQERKYEEIEALFQQGIKARSDVLLQQATTADARLRLLNAEQEYQRERLAILDMLGFALSDRYLFDTTEVINLLSQLSADTIEKTSDSLPETNQIAAQRFRITAEENKLAAARLSYLPSLAFSAGLSADSRIGTSAGSVTGDDDPSAAFSTGVALGVPLFDRKQRWLQVRNAEISLQSAKLDLERLQQSTSLAIAQASLDDAMARERITVNSVKRKAAQEALEAMEERYKAGASTLVELNAVQSSFAEAQSAFVQSRFDRIVSRVNLLHKTGRIDRIIALLNERPVKAGYK